MEYIHRKGVSHRDISPDNVPMDADGTIKIAGFSSAFLAQSEKKIWKSLFLNVIVERRDTRHRKRPLDTMIEDVE